MRPFDWERRARPSGLPNIERTQRREAAIQDINADLKAFRGHKCRAQWETSSQRKAKVVKQALSLSSSVDQRHPQGEPRRSVVDALREEEAAKKRDKEAQKASTAQRRLQLLQQARAVQARQEAERAAALKIHNASAKGLLEDSPLQ